MNIDYNYLRKELESLRREQRLLRYSAYLMIGLLAGVILISVLKLYYLTLASVTLVILLQLFYFRRKQKEYRSHLQRANLLAVKGGILGTEEVDEKGGAGLSVEALRNAELIAYREQGKAVNFFLGMNGRYKGLEIVSADAAIAQFYGDDSRKAEVSCGNWTHILLPLDSGLDIRLLDRDIMRQSTHSKFYSEHSNLLELDTADKGIPECYLFYKNSSAVYSEPELPALFKERLRSITGYTPGRIAISIRGREMDVYIRDRFLGRSFSIHGEPDEKLLTVDPYPELEKILELAAALN